MTDDAQPVLVETRAQRWTWLLYGVSGAAWLFLGLSARGSESSWYVLFLSTVGVVSLGGAVAQFRAHRRRLRNGA